MSYAIDNGIIDEEDANDFTAEEIEGFAEDFEKSQNEYIDQFSANNATYGEVIETLSNDSELFAEEYQNNVNDQMLKTLSNPNNDFKDYERENKFLNENLYPLYIKSRNWLEDTSKELRDANKVIITIGASSAISGTIFWLLGTHGGPIFRTKMKHTALAMTKVSIVASALAAVVKVHLLYIDREQSDLHRSSDMTTSAYKLVRVRSEWYKATSISFLPAVNSAAGSAKIVKGLVIPIITIAYTWSKKGNEIVI